MFVPHDLTVALAMMVLTMLCWGSWANTAKLVPGYRFELFYLDYSVGVLLSSLVLMWGLGDGFSAPNHAASSVLWALGSGVLFNIANFLLVAVIDLCGMAVAFPIAIGIALVFGTMLSALVKPSGNLWLLGAGVLLVLLAVLLDAAAYRRNAAAKGHVAKGMVLAVLCGVLMALFYPLLARAQLPPNGLDAYLAMVIFSSGVLVSSVLLVPLAAAHPITAQAPLAMNGYVQVPWQRHVPGILGGGIWCVGTTSNVLAAGVTGPAIAYAFGQGATMIAALSGVFIWREFRDAPQLNNLLALMFVCYAAGLVLIGLSPEA
jgi:glucose uptake protein